MNLGERLYELRRSKHLSQEDVAEKLEVTRQTVSKWENGQSTPDFDKIAPLCKIYGISTEELLTGNKKTEITEEGTNSNVKKKALGIGLGIFGYFVAISWIMVSIETFHIDEVLAAAIFLLLLGLSTFTVVYSSIVFSTKKKEKELSESEQQNKKLFKSIDSILSILTVIVYLLVSFLTSAWHITWIIFIISVLVSKVIKLVFVLKGEDVDDEE